MRPHIAQKILHVKKLLGKVSNEFVDTVDCCSPFTVSSSIDTFKQKTILSSTCTIKNHAMKYE